MKIFKNERTANNNESPIRKGTQVPDGAVSLAWYKSPDLNPKNNLVTIDTARFEGPEKSGTFVAYANLLGNLEDEFGNQAWPEEFPVVGDRFLLPDRIRGAADALPYVHVSRYFHLDYAGLAYPGSLTELNSQPEIKVTDGNGKEYLDENGGRKYKIFAVNAPITRPDNSRDAVYRILVFLNLDPLNDELYLSYHKVEIDRATNGLREEFIGYKEPLSVKEYYHYTPEEIEVVNQSSYDKKIYSTKPIDLKNQILGLTQPNYKGWKINVPKKAIPDTRKYEAFRWRVVCEYSRKVDPGEEKNSLIRAGVVTFNSSGPGASRCNYIFTQLNHTSYNTGGIKFINPLGEQDIDLTEEDAAYWNVPIQSISSADLNQFDILIYSITSKTADISSVMPKIEQFVKTAGKTFIFETSSRSSFTGIPDISFSDPLISLKDLAPSSDKVTIDDIRYYDYQPATPNSTTSGMYNGTWPPVIEDLLTDSAHSSSIVQGLNFLGGWDLVSVSDFKASSFMNYSSSNNLYLQYINSLGEDWDIVLESKYYNSEIRHPILARRKYNSGGSFYVSTACLFEDHVLDDDNNTGSTNYNVASLRELSAAVRAGFFSAADSTNMEGEQKLRVNIAMLSTAFRPSTNISPSSTDGFSGSGERHTVTLYSDWESSWVINADDDVLTAAEKNEFNFSLLPKSITDPNPVWMRILSDQTVGEIMAKKINQVDPLGINTTFRNHVGLNKTYMIMINNQNVETYTYNLIGDNTLPAAWTYTFSPKFNVPNELGRYIIKHGSITELDIGGGSDKSFPFKVLSKASYVTTNVGPSEIDVEVTFKGTAKAVYKLPDTQRTVTVNTPEVTTPGMPAVTTGSYIDAKLRWNTDQNTTLGPSGKKHLGNLLVGQGVETWSDSNYSRVMLPTNWGSWGMRGWYAKGSTGQAVKNIQLMLNQFIFFGMVGGAFLAVDGIYGSVTENRILAFQIARGAIYLDGIVDAETWSLIGYAMAELNELPGWRQGHTTIPNPDMLTWGDTAARYLRLYQISDTRNMSLGFMKQSWARNGPASTSEGFLLKFNAAYSQSDQGGVFNISRLFVKPYFFSYDQSQQAVIDWLDVGNNISLPGYNYSTASHPNTSAVLSPGQYTSIPFTKRAANSVFFRVRKDGGSGQGTARMFGIQDVYVLGQTYVSNTTPAVSGSYTPASSTTSIITIPGQTLMVDIEIESTQKFKLASGVPQTAATNPTNGTWVGGIKIVKVDDLIDPDLAMKPQEISEVRWTETPVVSPASKQSLITFEEIISTVSGQNTGQTYRLIYDDNITILVTGANFIKGSNIGDGSTEFYTKSVDGIVEPYPRLHGWVSKNQGILLICDENGNPIGFPAGSPRASSNNQEDLHYTQLSMDVFDTGQEVFYGFYDAKTKQWLENVRGEPKISYYDYVRRGTKNIFMAVQTTAESETPYGNAIISRPFSLAMPVYSVTTRNESSVRIRNPNEELGRYDIWPISIGTGSFTKQISVTQEYASSATNYLRDYGSKTLTAHYSLREGERGPWSNLLGRPYKDIKSEEPRLLSDDTFVVNYSPIASIQEPTYYPNPADPVTPLFTIYRRDSVGSAWGLVEMKDVKEYNLQKGIITLKTPLVRQDSKLLRVNYTSRDYAYHYKYDGTKKVNLNPYILKKTEGDDTHIVALDKPLYVYLEPSFVVNNDTKNIINESKQDQIVKITTERSIFDKNQADYNPLAYQIGIIFIMTSIDINELKILDTRVRGGGAQHHLSVGDLDNDGRSYWDATAERPYAYQRGGFVLIRLPREILGDFTTEESIRRVIDRNITTGVAYELQDYAGEPLFG